MDDLTSCIKPAKQREHLQGVSLIRRMFAYTDLEGDGCWEWQASVNANGYGVLYAVKDDKPTSILAHRLSFEFFHGSIPAGYSVLHRCDNPRCLNPVHLFTGTRAENVADMISKGRSRALSGQENGFSKLTEGQVLEILELQAQGLGQRQIAMRFGVGRTTVSHILAGRTWRHLRVAEGAKNG